MKKLCLLFIGIFLAMMVSSPSYAEWTSVGSDENGNTHYVDFDRIRESNGYVYFWRLKDRLKPDDYGYFSITVYHELDCSLLRIKYLSLSYYKLPMGGGSVETDNNPGKEWSYPPPGSGAEYMCEKVCDSIGK